LFTFLLWVIFKLAVVSTVLIILIDFFAIMPTYRKTYKKPFEEAILMPSVTM
jgi:hypothetical protein